MSLRVGILGATGLVGETLLRVMEERSFPVSDLIPLASPRSAGTRVKYAGQLWPVEAATPGSFAGLDLVLASAGGSVSRTLLPHAAAAGALSVDNTSAFRMHADVPLVVPEVNGERVSEARKGIVANPNCSTIQLTMALKPIQDSVGLRRVRVSTYQSVSGAGRVSLQQLRDQSAAALTSDAGPEADKFAFNAIPHIDTLMDDGSTREEWKMAAETSRILGADVPLHATCVRVPTLAGHGVVANIETEEPATPDQIAAILSRFPGVIVHQATPRKAGPTVLDAAGRDEVRVGRIRKDPTVDRGISLWIVADNIRKGAALNTVQIAETLLRTGMLSPKGTPTAIG